MFRSISAVLKKPRSYQDYPSTSWEKFVLSLNLSKEYLDIAHLPDEAGFLLLVPSGKIRDYAGEIEAKSKVAISNRNSGIFAFYPDYGTAISDGALFNGLVKHGRLFVDELKKFRKVYLYKFSEEELARLHHTLSMAKVGDLLTGRSHLVGTALKSFRL